jgi:rod shape-determining protein MreD
MAERVRRQIYVWRAGLAGFVVLVMLWRLLPPTAEAGRWPAPDWLLVVACAVVLRRPEFLPAGLLAVLVLAEDLLLMRPPGLWAALVLGGVEFLRGRAAFSRELSVLAEWAMVAVVIVLIFLVNQLVLILFFVPQPAVWMTGIHLAGTIAVYPLVVMALRYGAGMRKPATGELDVMGQKL